MSTRTLPVLKPRSEMRCFYSAEDVRQLLQRKHLLARIKLARLYARKAGEVLHTIKVSSYDEISAWARV